MNSSDGPRRPTSLKQRPQPSTSVETKSATSLKGVRTSGHDTDSLTVKGVTPSSAPPRPTMLSPRKALKIDEVSSAVLLAPSVDLPPKGLRTRHLRLLGTRADPDPAFCADLHA